MRTVIFCTTLLDRQRPEADNLFTSIAGLPGIVVPAGFTSEGLPVGLEISGFPFSEASLLGLAYDYEQATLHRSSPDSLLDGNNRIYAGSGDDTLILGEGDRVLAGEGDDAIFTTNGGDNTITGVEGADQFWIASGELPDSANIITDFTGSEDVIGLAGLGIGFEDVSITAVERDVLISANDSKLAILQGIEADSLTADDFE